MKKILAALIIIVLSCTLVACGNLYCNSCGEISFEKKHKVNLFGRKGYLCEDCYKFID